MDKFSMEAFQEFKVSNTSEIKGGACTGGGFENYGNGSYMTWESDETCGDGSTEYYDVEIVYQ